VHEYLVAAGEELGLALTNIRHAAQQSDEALEDARNIAVGVLVEAGVIEGESDDLELGLVAFGSLARAEASQAESDFDHAILAYGTVDTPEHIQRYRRAADEVCKKTGLKRPGASRIFGGLISGSDLVNRIGLDDDTNRTHTQRMLFLEESIPIIGVARHKQTVKAILKRYLVDYREPGLEKPGVPRFLLNDIVRYWRTIAVDYQAKRWDELNPFETEGSDDERAPKWGMRYIKLRSTRKLAFCGTVTAILAPRLRDVAVDEELLCSEFEAPALARLAGLLAYLDHDQDRDALRQILELADWFAEKFGDGDFRAEVNEVEHPRRPENNAAFAEARGKTEDLQRALEMLFQSTHPLRVSRQEGLSGFPDRLCLNQLTARYLLF
jgi:hypothetical protein